MSMKIWNLKIELGSRVISVSPPCSMKCERRQSEVVLMLF
ncbi:unnamed protein product [Acanthoscelides obtectus]|uniref:Uncharacterized protein n=1 Tax=Acanthoscelides obtectus TaxID=200917 RepID=A0A9P0MBJ2_ACAOB|nr:unnamed protein product [Acanthoscelides obtectus]CAK1640180.1 hypothetical protein AOBTE_LOCUS11581 [Acanthoscelides obtectus]